MDLIDWLLCARRIGAGHHILSSRDYGTLRGPKGNFGASAKHGSVSKTSEFFNRGHLQFTNKRLINREIYTTEAQEVKHAEVKKKINFCYPSEVFVSS